MRVFLKETNIWINRLSKGHCHLQCWWALSNLLRTWIGHNGGGREESWYSWFSGLLSQKRTYIIGSLAFRNLNYTTGFPGSPTCRQKIDQTTTPIWWPSTPSLATLTFFLHTYIDYLWNSGRIKRNSNDNMFFHSSTHYKMISTLDSSPSIP